MTNNANQFSIPAKRYFTLEELCELVQISPAQFAQWQHEKGSVIGYGGNLYTRADLLKLLKLKDTFSPFIDDFNQNTLDSEGNPAADAVEVRSGLKTVLSDLEKVLAVSDCAGKTQEH